MKTELNNNSLYQDANSKCIGICSIEKGMRLIGSKWKGPILYHLKDGPIRFNDLVRLLGGASKKMVGQRLKELESAGLILRKITSESPVAITYELTSFGRSTIDVLAHLKAWSEKYQIS